MYAMGPNNNLWLSEAIGMDATDCGMPNDSNIALFGQWGVSWVRMGAKLKNSRFCSYGNFGDKNQRFHLPAE